MTASFWALTRRALLGGLAGLAGARGIARADAGSAVPATAAVPGGPSPAGKCLVCVFLRGALDGLSLVVPYTEGDYYRERRGIAVARPGKRDGALDLDGRFGLHPAFAALRPAFARGELAFVHAVGSPHPTRSHFDAQEYMESGAVGATAREGWLARSLSTRARARDAVPAVALGERAPLALRGFGPALSARSLRELRVVAPEVLGTSFERGLAKLYAAEDDLATRAGKHALELSARLSTVIERHATPENGADYPSAASPFREVAALIKAGVGLEAAWVDVFGWDTHRGQRESLARSLGALARSLAAFRADLGERFEHVVVLVMSEFGRTIRENGTGGTDHGHGTAMTLFGGPVRGGVVYGDFPGLGEEQRHQRRDLAVTTDFRDLFAEVLHGHWGAAGSDSPFPGYALDPRRRRGVLR